MKLEHIGRSKITALIIIGVLFYFCQPRDITTELKQNLARQFKFNQIPLTDFPKLPHQNIRKVSPCLKKIDAWISALGAAITVGDLDQDGLPNDYAHVDPRINKVIIATVPNNKCNRYDPFILESNEIYSKTVAATGTLFYDFNEDGQEDILVYYWGRPPIIFLRSNSIGRLNAQNFHPIEITDPKQRWYTNCASLADFNGDGHMDIVFGNYLQDGARILDETSKTIEELPNSKSKAFNGGRTHFLISKGNPEDLQYVDISNCLNREISEGWTIALATFDLNHDQKPDIYLANDVGPDRLLLNCSKGDKLSFKLLVGRRKLATAKSAVMGKDSFKGMGVDIADINADGLPDIFVSNIASRYRFLESHFLFINNGRLDLLEEGIAPFDESAAQYGLSESGWGWDCRIADFNCDGIPEVYQAMGCMKGKINRWPELQAFGSVNEALSKDPQVWPALRAGDDISGDEKNAFFVKAQDSKYYDISNWTILGKAMLTRGIAVADCDHDGDLDILVANQWENSYYFENESIQIGDFLGIDLFCRTANGNLERALGVQVDFQLDGRNYTSFVDGGSGHSGKRSQDIFIALGKKTKEQFPIKVSFLDANGQIKKETFLVSPGWQKIIVDRKFSNLQEGKIRKESLLK